MAEPFPSSSLKVLKAYKYRAYPHPNMEPILHQYCGMSRFVWNRLVEENERRNKLRYQEKKAFAWLVHHLLCWPACPLQAEDWLVLCLCFKRWSTPFLANQGKNNKFEGDPTLAIFTFAKELKHQEGRAWLAEFPSRMLLKVCNAYGTAFADAFKQDEGKKGFPQFKSRDHNATFGSDDMKVCVDGSYITLPKAQGVKDPHRKALLMHLKIGRIPFKQHRLLVGVPKNVTFSYKAGQWFVAIQVEGEIPLPVHPQQGTEHEVVGVDRGVVQTAALSTGVLLPQPKAALAKAEAKRVKLQQALSRKLEKNGKNKRSKRYQRIKQRLAKASHHIQCVRHDFVHKLTHQLTQDHVVVVLEDLKTKNMTRSAKGTLAAPGNKVKAKAGLNRSILAQNWFEMQRQLTYKAQWQGGRVETVAAAYTSQTCHKCGNVNKKSRVKQALFTCVACGHEAHADVNAAKNIRQKFLEAKAPKTAGGLLVEERGGDLA